MATRFASIIGILLIAPWVYATEQLTLVRVTTYWREEGQLRAAFNGTRLRNGHCAVDPKKIAYGSRILLEEEELLAVDTGPAVINRKAARLTGRSEAERNAVVIDRYFETKSQAMAWEKSHPHFMRARVLTPGMASAISKKSAPRGKSLPPQTIIAARQINRPLVLRPAIPIGDFYFSDFLGSSSAIARNARRRSGGDLPFADNIRAMPGGSLEHFRLPWLQIG